jgi:hypothetical protein
MGPRLQLEIAPAGVLAVVPPERTLDIHGVRIVPLDQVAVIAVHRPHKGREGGEQAGREAAPESGGFLRKIEGEVGQTGAVRGALGNREWLHQRNQLPPVHRFHGRFFVAAFNVHKCFYISILDIFQAFLWPPEWPL